MFFYDIIYYRAPDPEAQDARIPIHDLPRYVHLIFDQVQDLVKTVCRVRLGRDRIVVGFITT